MEAGDEENHRRALGNFAVARGDDVGVRRRIMKAFVTDGDERPALAITRSLGRRGVSVLVGDERPVSLASSSRYCVRHVTYPSPYRCPGAFDRFLLDFLERERIDVVVPVTDVTTHSVARNRAALPHHCSAAAPSVDVFDFVTDKWSLLQHADRCGIPIPRTHFVDGAAEVKPLLARIEYPAVIKPARSRVRTDLDWVPTSVHYAHSEADLLRLYTEVPYLAAYPSLIQERIVGPGLGIFVLCDHGRLRAMFAHRRLREKPPSGGASVLCESLAVDPRFRDQAICLLGSLGWHGVAMMEYKLDRRTGNPVLMEVNGRFWGSLQLSVDAGVDFPYLSYQLALGQPLDLPSAYAVGVRSRWLLGDLDHLLLRLFHSDRDLTDLAPSKLRSLIEFLTCAGTGVRHDVFRGDDPRPMFHELWRYAKTLAGSAGERMGQQAGRIGWATASKPVRGPDPHREQSRATQACRSSRTA